MFVNLTPNENSIKEWKEALEKCKRETPSGDWDKMVPLTDCLWMENDGTEHPGFYIGQDYELWLFDEFSVGRKQPDYFDSYMFFSYDSDFRSQYGVADNYEQIVKKFKREAEDQTRKFFVLVTGYSLDDADNNEKFYKQGTYIGKCQRPGAGEYSPSRKTEEVKNNGYLVGYHIYPFPGTEPYSSRRYSVLKKYIIGGEAYINGDTKMEIIRHSDGDDFWRRNGDVKVRITRGSEVEEETVTVYSYVHMIYNDKCYKKEKGD